VTTLPRLPLGIIGFYRKLPRKRQFRENRTLLKEVNKLLPIIHKFDVGAIWYRGSTRAYSALEGRWYMLAFSASRQHWKHLTLEPRELCSWFVVCTSLPEDVPAWVVLFPSLIPRRQYRISTSNYATNVSFRVLYDASFTNIPGTGTLARLLLKAKPQPNVFWLGELFFDFLYNKVAKQFSSCNCISYFLPNLCV
jgi:hypothetical protein